MSEDDRRKLGMIFNVQKYSLHDGPGIRTIIFFKGCILRCRWCSNPESQRPEPELAFNSGRCIGVSRCGHCIVACPFGSIRMDGDDKQLVIDRSRCAGCETRPCASACPAQGLLVYGQKRTVDDVLNVVEQDMAFYARSGGGVTLSGGEPLLQREFAVATLREARQRRLRTSVETCGMVPGKNIREAAPYLTHVLFDIKHMDSAVHREQTGQSNERILENFHILVNDFDMPILARTPVVPGFNDNEEAIAAIATFLKPFDRVEYEMLPYHRLGTQKYQFLNRPMPMGDARLDQARLDKLQKVAEKILGVRLHIPH